MAVHVRTRPPLVRHPAPPRPSRLAVIVNWTINLGALMFAGIVIYLLWPYIVARFTNVPTTEQLAAPTVQAVRPQPQVFEQAPAQPVQAPAAPIQEAAPQAQPVQEAVPVAPPAEIAVPTPMTIVKPDLSQPLNLAPGSFVPTATIAPTVVTTAPMIAGKDFSYNKDGTCVETSHKGQKVRFCQLRPMNMGEMSAVADYLRTGMIAGEVVK